MLSDKEKTRYARHLSLDEIGESGQLKLRSAKILVIGAGGLGCPALQYLVSAGVGHIGMVDGDVVESSNLQRQILYKESDIGKFKVECARNHLSGLNSLIKFEIYPTVLSNSNALKIISDYDIVIDGTDNFSARYLINDACCILDKPYIYGAIYKFQAQISLFNFNNGPTYRCLFPNPPNENDAPNCNEIGVLGVLPGIAGTLQALECLKVILGFPDNLNGRLLIIDTLKLDFTKVFINKSDVKHTLQPKNETELSEFDYTSFCSSVENEEQISVEELIKILNSPYKLRFLDVREKIEFPRPKEFIDLEIPLNQLNSSIAILPKDEKILVICQSGIRSLKAIKILKQNGIKNTINLKGGINAWINMKNQITSI